MLGICVTTGATLRLPILTSSAAKATATSFNISTWLVASTMKGFVIPPRTEMRHELLLIHRQWGDAPVHSLAAALFLEPHEIHYFEDIGYGHPPFLHCPANAPGGQLPDSQLINSDPWYEPMQGGVGCRCQCNPVYGAKQGRVDGTCNRLLRRGVT